jgi:uncharacterized protein YggE
MFALRTSATTLCLAALLCSTAPARAEETYKPDDRVSFMLSTEGWATTTTARVVVSVDAAVTGAAAGNARADMQKAVGSVAKADWRLTDFSRSQDPTGLERWNASFEARIPEGELGGIHDSAKKASKAGMQLTVQDVAFDPTMAETESVKAKLRADLYKQANDQLGTLNATIPGRQYRITAIDFMNNNMPPMPMVRPMAMARNMAMTTSAGVAMAEDGENMQRAEKIVMMAQVYYGAVAPVAGK